MTEMSLMVKMSLAGVIALLALLIAAYHVILDPRRAKTAPPPTSRAPEEAEARSVEAV